MRSIRRTKHGIIHLKRTVASVQDECTGKTRRFHTYEEASAYATQRLEAAKLAGEQHQDRFYLWHAGECYSIGS